MGLKKYKYGYTAGSWDCLHRGHINLLRKAKEQCKFLTVAVSTDELIKNHKGIYPVIPYPDRVDLIKELRCVDNVVMQWRLLDMYDIFPYVSSDEGMVFLGDDWQGSDNLNITLLKLYNMITFFPYTKDVSSSEIKAKIIQNSDAILKAQQKRKQNNG